MLTINIDIFVNKEVNLLNCLICEWMSLKIGKYTMENWCGIALTPLSATPSQNHISPALTELSHSFSDGEFLSLKQGNLLLLLLSYIIYKYKSLWTNYCPMLALVLLMLEFIVDRKSFIACIIIHNQ